MKRHRTDLVALIFGLSFAMVGAGFLVNETAGRDFNAGWATAIGLITLGLVALATTLVRRPDDEGEASLDTAPGGSDDASAL
jgi:hypothetical protein